MHILTNNLYTGYEYFFAYIDDDDICLSLFMILCPVGLSC